MNGLSPIGTGPFFFGGARLAEVAIGWDEALLFVLLRVVD